MIYVYRSVPSTSARDLAAALNGRRLRRLEALRRGDVVVCWGSRIQNVPDGVRAINNVPIGNKLQDVERLTRAGVPTITISQTRPQVRQTPAVAARPAVDPFMEQLGRSRNVILDITNASNRPNQAQINAFMNEVSRLSLAFNLPVQPAVEAVAARPAEEWLPRIIDHVGGLDLLTPPQRPEFWVRKENIVQEFRIHSFLGRSIRSAVKVRREDVPDDRASAWVRSWDGGWRMAYRDGAVRQNHRDIAHQAVRALGLEFGAVDVGQKADGSLIVLEVNRAPGLSEGSAQVYANAVTRWMNGEMAQQEAR